MSESHRTPSQPSIHMFSSLLPKPQHAAHETIPVVFLKDPVRSALVVVSENTSLKPQLIPNPNATERTLAELYVDVNGTVDYAKTVSLSQDSSRAVQASYEDTIPLKEKYPNLKHHFPRYTLQNCPDDSLASVLESTRQVINDLIAKNAGVSEKSAEPTFVTYTPSGIDETEDRGRTIEIRDYKEDPMLPPKFKLRKNRHKDPSPPPPVLKPTSTVKVTKELKDQWKIPSVVSNWKNNQGFAISLDKRVKAASGGGIAGEATINVEKFGLLSLALEDAHNKARDEIRIRNQQRKEQSIQEQQQKEEQIKQLLERTRMERSNGKRPGDSYNYERKKSRR